MGSRSNLIKSLSDPVNSTDDIFREALESEKQTKKLVRKLPTAAAKLYISLYCNQKGLKELKEKKMIEATKSWISLNEFEKQRFYDKYMEYKIKLKEKVIDVINKAEPYMKKNCKSTTVDIINDSKPTDLTEDKDHCDDAVKQTEDHKINIDDNISDSTHLLESLHEAIIRESDLNDLSENHNPSPCHTEAEDLYKSAVPEPTPPMLKSGKELYELINPLKDANGVTWNSLSSIEKSRYNRAVLTLKKDYISNYKKFLENLTSRELFDYYYKTI